MWQVASGPDLHPFPSDSPLPLLSAVQIECATEVTGGTASYFVRRTRFIEAQRLLLLQKPRSNSILWVWELE